MSELPLHIAQITMEATIQFADDLKPVKSNVSHSDSIGVGGVYSMRPRSSLHDRRSSFDRIHSHEKGLPEDEDPGLRAEGDYKKRQVKHTLLSSPWDDLTLAVGL